jgi:hypothetical protein
LFRVPRQKTHIIANHGIWKHETKGHEKVVWPLQAWVTEWLTDNDWQRSWRSGMSCWNFENLTWQVAKKSNFFKWSPTNWHFIWHLN